MKLKITATVDAQPVVVTIEAPDEIKAQCRSAIVELLANYIAQVTAMEIKEIA